LADEILHMLGASKEEIVQEKIKLSPRLKAIVEALPLYPGMRVLEIGCGPGAAARAVANRIGEGYILAIDRSSTAIQQAIKSAQEEIALGRLNFRQVAVEELKLDSGEQLYDIAFAVRVGALDGRHPEMEQVALARIAKALTKNGKLLIDGGNPLREIPLGRYH
jgi:ubiquinone/menaquinone biosynthesis C-methylase UbiE